MHQGGPDQGDTEAVHERRRFDARQLLAKYDTLLELGTAAAVLLRPRDSDPSAGVHLAMPLQMVRPSAAARLHEFANLIVARAVRRRVRLEPGAKLAPKGLGLLAIVEIHILPYRSWT